MLFISFFLYFIIVRKSIRTFEKENDGINGMVTRNSFDSSKKGIQNNTTIFLRATGIDG
jgi:hypothetical protein